MQDKSFMGLSRKEQLYLLASFLVAVALAAGTGGEGTAALVAVGWIVLAVITVPIALSLQRRRQERLAARRAANTE